MKKKLVTFIISIFLAVVCFTNAVHADISTAQDFFDSYGTKFLASTSYAFGNGNATFYLDEAGGDYIFVFDSVSLQGYDSSNGPLSGISITKESNTVYKISDYTTYGGQTITLEFTINGTNISSIEISGFTNYDTFLNGTYTESIASVLSTVDGGFPFSSDDSTIPDDSWISSSGIRVFCNSINSSLLIPEAGGIEIPTSTQVSKDADGNYIATFQMYIMDFTDINLKFFMSNNKLVKIFIDAPFFGLSFYFEPLGNRKTLEALFSELDNDPDSSTNTWVNENNMHLYLNYVDGFIYVNELTLSSTDDNIYSVLACLKPSSDGSKYEDDVLLFGFYQSHITAFIENSKIKRLKIDFEDSVIDNTGYDADIKQLIKKVKGTYSAPVTIADLLDTAEGGFPISTDDNTIPEDAWYDLNGFRLAFSKDKTKVIIFTGGSSNTPIPSDMTLSKDVDGNYTVDFNYTQSRHVDMKFIMNNNKLVKIEVRDYFTFDFEPLGNRSSFKLLFDTLTNKPDSDANTWVNEKGHQFYINGNFLYSKDFDASIYTIHTPMNKSGNNYIASPLLIDAYDSTVTAYMRGGILTSFKIDVSDSVISGYPSVAEALEKIRGTYSAPITVGDILGTFNNFPTSSESGWLKEDNGKKVYLDGTSLKFDGTTISTDKVVTKDGNNYKLEDTFSTCIFVMESNKLKSIDFTLAMGPAVTGTYVPYRFTKQPSNISPGYTGDIEFVTNGKYVDQTSTAVNITVDNLPLNYGTDFEVTPGSTHIKILGSFLSGLANGEHPLEITMTGYSPLTSKIFVGSSGGGGSSGYSIPNTGIK